MTQGRKMRMTQRAGFLAVLVLAALIAAPASAESRYGSIVFSQESGGGWTWGMAWSYDSQRGATARAMDECRSRGGTNCRRVGWFRDACGALAIGDRNGYGANWGSSSSEAEERAIELCRNANRNCRVAASRCAR